MKPMGATSWIIRWVTVGLAVSSTGAIAPVALAQVIPDNTLPTPSITDPGCTVCTIDGGTQQNNNLFHSFSEFSVPTNGAAIFNNLETIENIFSRITGDSVSDIDGLLRTRGAANLFLLNPNGIIFGPNAQLDIPGSFTASTANSLIFSNGEEFSAVNPEAPPLLTLSISPGLQSGTGAYDNQATLTTQGNLVTGQDLTLTAGQLDIQGQLAAGGNLRLIATDQVRLRDRITQPLIITAQDELRVRGDQTVEIFALNHPQSGLFAGGDLILQSENSVLGDARYESGGNFRVLTLEEDLGTLTSPQDPVIRTLGDVTFDTYIGSSLHILAGGSVDIGTVAITQPETGVVAEGFLQDTFQLSNGTEVNIDGSAQPTLDIRAGVSPDAIATTGITGADPGSDLFLNGPNLSSTATRADITVGDVFIPEPDALVVLTNQYRPAALAGGDITVTGNGFFGSGIDVRGTDQPGGAVIVDARDNIIVESGIDSSAALADAGDITLLAEGNINLMEGSRISANGLSGGNILLQSSGTFSAADDSLIDSSSTGLTPSASRGSITFLADSVELFGEQTAAIAFTTGVRAGSPVVIRANDTVTLDSSSIFTFSDDAATGSSGNITLTTQTLNLVQGGSVNSFTTGEGRAGSITVTATDSFTIDGVSQNDFPSGLASNADLGSQGDAGNISITTPQFTMTNGASLSTASFGLGNAGNVTITVENMMLDGSSTTQTGQDNLTNIFTTAREGEGGNIQVTGQTLAVTNGARLFVTTDIIGQGDAGNIILNLTDEIAISGTTPSGRPSAVTTNALTGSDGNGGDIIITTGNFSLTNRGRFSTETQDSGQGGNITVDSQTFFIGEDAQFSASSIGADGGQAGDITVRTDQFTMDGSGFLFTTTEGRFDAGNIELEIRDRATLSGPDTGIFAGTESPQATGDGGNIRVTGPRQISLQDGATIEANNQGTGVGGNIQLEADVLSLDGNTTVTATTTSNQGGNITLALQDALLLRNGSQISTTAGLAQAGGDGGNVTIDAAEGFVVAVPEEDSDIVADAFTGRGGNIRIITQGVFGIEPRSQPTPLSDIRASSELGVDGTIEITDLNTDPAQGLITLPSDLLDESQLLAEGCEQITADSSAQGEFYTSGRGGITPLTSDVLGSDDVIDDLRLPEAAPDDASITEAQGWFVNDDDTVVLTATCWR